MYAKVLTDYLLFLAPGAGMILLSLLIWFAPKRLRRLFSRRTGADSTRFPAGFIALLAFPLGVLIVVLAVSGPSPRERARVLSNVVEASPDDIVRVGIMPKSPSSLRMLDITSRAQKEEFCDALHQAEWYSRQSAGDRWSCDMSVRRLDESVRCAVFSNKDGRVVLTVKLGSRTIGMFRCDPLGPLIERWSKETETRTQRNQGETK